MLLGGKKIINQWKVCDCFYQGYDKKFENRFSKEIFSQPFSVINRNLKLKVSFQNFLPRNIKQTQQIQL